MKTKPVTSILLFTCVLAIVSCSEVKELVSKPKVTLGMTMNIGGPCPGASGLDALRSCGPDSDELKQMFRTAFVSESACHGVELHEMTDQEKVIPKDTPGYLEIRYLSPSQWSYQVWRLSGDSLLGRVKSEHEIAEQVCHIVKGTGGKI